LAKLALFVDIFMDFTAKDENIYKTTDLRRPKPTSVGVGRSYSETQAKKSVGWWEPAVEIFTQVSAWIAGPIIIALFLGKWLDQKYQTEPWLFLLCIGLAFAASSFGIVRITLNYIKKIEEESRRQAQTKSQTIQTFTDLSQTKKSS